MALGTLLTKSAMLRLVARQRDQLAPLIAEIVGGTSRADALFALCVRNTAPSAATVRAASDLRASVVLVPNGAPHLLAEATMHAGAEAVVDHDEATGVPFLVRGGRGALAGTGDDAHAANRARGWLRSAALDGGRDGACIVATSGSGQMGSKLVAYRWDQCDMQAEETVRRTLNDAAAAAASDSGQNEEGSGSSRDDTGSAVRFIAASNVGHAYNLNGFLSALRAPCVSEVGVPATADELALILASGPTSDDERAAGATVLFGTPRMYADLLRVPAVMSGDVGRALRELLVSSGHYVHAYSAGCPLPAQVRRSVFDALGFVVRQNYGSSETGNVALQDISRRHRRFLPEAWGDDDDDDDECIVGVPWGKVQLRPPLGGVLLPHGAEGEVCVAVPWASVGYLRGGELVPHADPYIRMGDAGAFVSAKGVGHSGKKELQLMGRLRPPLEVRTGGMRVLLQQYEVEEAMLRANPTTVRAAAALQGPSGELWCAVAMENTAAQLNTLLGGIQPDRVLRLDELPISPAGKVLYSELVSAFEDMSD